MKPPTTSGFTGSVLGRLDAMRDHRHASAFLASNATGAPMGLGYGDGSRARPTGPSSRLTAYTMGTFQGGNRSNSFEQVGFDVGGRITKVAKDSECREEQSRESGEVETPSALTRPAPQLGSPDYSKPCFATYRGSFVGPEPALESAADALAA